MTREINAMITDTDGDDEDLHASPYNALGVDVSRWQPGMSWRKTILHGISFAFLKCTQGSTGVDAEWLRNWEGTGEVGILRGAYHYYMSSVPPLEQAAWFISHYKPCELPPVVDIEDSSTSTTDYSGKLLYYLAEVEARTGQRPMIYTAKAYWEARYSLAVEWADQYPLWIASYRSDSGPSVPLPWHPLGWEFWQFTSKGCGPKYGTNPAYSKSIDLNVYRSSEAELRARYA